MLPTSNRQSVRAGRRRKSEEKVGLGAGQAKRWPVEGSGGCGATAPLAFRRPNHSNLRRGCGGLTLRCSGTYFSTRASGGIGRRAGFRFLCPKGREGSSPSSRTALTPGGSVLEPLFWASVSRRLLSSTNRAFDRCEHVDHTSCYPDMCLARRLHSGWSQNTDFNKSCNCC